MPRPHRAQRTFAVSPGRSGTHPYKIEPHSQRREGCALLSFMGLLQHVNAAPLQIGDSSAPSSLSRRESGAKSPELAPNRRLPELLTRDFRGIAGLVVFDLESKELVDGRQRFLVPRRR